MSIHAGMNVAVYVPSLDKIVTGRVTSTAHRGTELISIGFYSRELGHTNYIDDAILVEAEDVVGVPA